MDEERAASGLIELCSNPEWAGPRVLVVSCVHVNVLVSFKASSPINMAGVVRWFDGMGMKRTTSSALNLKTNLNEFDASVCEQTWTDLILSKNLPRKNTTGGSGQFGSPSLMLRIQRKVNSLEANKLQEKTQPPTYALQDCQRIAKNRPFNAKAIVRQAILSEKVSASGSGSQEYEGYNEYSEVFG